MSDTGDILTSRWPRLARKQQLVLISDTEIILPFHRRSHAQPQRVSLSRSPPPHSEHRLHERHQLRQVHFRDLFRHFAEVESRDVAEELANRIHGILAPEGRGFRVGSARDTHSARATVVVRSWCVATTEPPYARSQARDADQPREAAKDLTPILGSPRTSSHRRPDAPTSGVARTPCASARTATPSRSRSAARTVRSAGCITRTARNGLTACTTRPGRPTPPGRRARTERERAGRDPRPHPALRPRAQPDRARRGRREPRHRPREIVGLVGESGSGKSTLGKTMLGLHDKTAGRGAVQARDPANPLRAGRLPAFRAFDADDLPGPLLVAEPAHDRGRDRRRGATTAHEPRRARDSGERRELARTRGAQRRPHCPLSARTLRRAAPAHRDCPGAHHGAGVRRLRRADLGVGRFRAGAGGEPARGAEGVARAHDAVHRARSVDGALHLRPDGGDVSRVADRTGARGPGVLSSEASVCGDAFRVESGARSRYTSSKKPATNRASSPQCLPCTPTAARR